MNTKYRQKLTRILFLITLSGYSIAANALGVGSLTVESKLNQPLNAHIELLSTEGVEPSQITAVIAKSSIFERAGVDYSPALNDINLKISTNSNGTPYIDMSSQQSLQEPLVNLILEVKWKQQRLLRKFTITLEPAPIEKVTETPKPEKAVIAQNEPEVKTPKPIKNPAPTENQQQPVATNTSIKVYEVKTNKDTLWSIATQFRPNKSYSMDQVMKEILKQNPSAFLNNNINLLKTGSTLRFDSSLLSDQTTQKSTQAVVKKVAQKPLKTLPLSSSSEVKTYKVKNKETLWSIASKLRPDSTYNMNKIMSALLKQNPEAFLNNDISQLKKGAILSLNIHQLGNTTITKAPSPEKRSTTPVIKHTEHVQTTPLTSPLDKNSEHISAQKDLNEDQVKSATIELLMKKIDSVQQQIVEIQNLLMDNQSELTQLKSEVQIHLATETAITPETTQLKSDLSTAPPTLETFTDHSQQVIAEAPEVSHENFSTEPLTPLVDVIEHENTQEGGLFSSLMSNLKLVLISLGTILLGIAGFFLYRHLKSNKEDTEVNDEYLEDTTLTDQAPTFDQELKQYQEPKTITDMETGEDVPLDSDLRALYEADIYIACQRYSRAEESLMSAIELNPERIEIKLKLLEVYLVSQNHEKFIKEAGIFQSKIGEHDPKWKDVVDMGRQLCPDHPLFSGEISSDEIILSEESVPSNESIIQSEELQDNDLPPDLSPSEDIFKAEHSSSIDLDESDLFAGQTNEIEEQDIDLSSIQMDDDDDKNSSLDIGADDYNKTKTNAI